MMAGLIQHLLLTAGLALWVAVVCRLARSRPAVCHGLWLLVLVKLMIPPGLVTPWRVPVALPELDGGARGSARSGLPGGGSISGAAGWTDPGAEVSGPPATGEPDRAPVGPPEPVAEGAMIAGSSSGPAPRSTGAAYADRGEALVDVLYWTIVALWIGGTLTAAGAHGLRLRRFRPLLARASPAPEPLLDTVRAVASRLAVKPPETVVVEGPISPILWCVGRPRLVWPAALLDRLPREAWSDIVAHELAHLRRRDHWVGWLLLTAGFVWWWNPLFWITRRRLHVWAELACDAWVVKLRPAGRRCFARTLIEVSRLVSRAARPLPAMGMSAAAFQELERRLTMILHHRTAERLPLWGALLLAVVGLAVLPGISFSQADDPPGKKKKKKSVVSETIVEAPVRSRVETEAAEDAVEDIAEETPEEGEANIPPAPLVARVGGLPRRLPGFCPSQATGAPDTMGSGLKPTAWTPRRPDAGKEWLLLRFRHRVLPRVLRIYETHHPGAVVRVCAMVGDDAEVLLWEGVDPVPPDRKHAIATIGVDPRLDRVVAVRMIKIYLDTKRVKGRNAIDAVELVGEEGPQFACEAWASSSLTGSRSRGGTSAPVARSGRAGTTHFFGRATRPATSAGATGSAPAPRRGRRGSNMVIAAGGGVVPGSFRKGRHRGRLTLRAPAVQPAAVPPAQPGRATSGTRPPRKAAPRPTEESRILKLERELAELKQMIRRLEKKLGSDI